jgi:hypothetical protein
MKAEEKTALIAESTLLHGRINLQTLASISIQEAMKRCKNYGSKSKIARARKVFKNVLKGFSRERLLYFVRKMYIEGLEKKSRTEIIQLIDNAYIRTIIHSITLQEMVEQHKKLLEEKKNK